VTLSHSLLCNSASSPYPAGPLYVIPDVLTCFLRKYTYFYISQNNFESCNQIIISTGYKHNHLEYIFYDSTVTHDTTIQLSIDCIVVLHVTTITEYVLINRTMGTNHLRINHLGLV